VQESEISSKPGLPFWMRIGVACVMFAVALLQIWKGFWVEWVPYFCFGLYFLIYVPRQKGEALGAYLSKPQRILSLVLLIVTIGGFGYNLYVVFRG
jgi:hypothetical protein